MASIGKSISGFFTGASAVAVGAVNAAGAAAVATSISSAAALGASLTSLGAAASTIPAATVAMSLGGGTVAGAAATGGIGASISGALMAVPGWGWAAAGVIAALAIFSKGARSFDEIIKDDYLPDLFGSQMKGEAIGHGGAIGFNGGNTGILGANFGVKGTGLVNQLLTEGGENGGVGYFTGAQKNLEGFAALLKQNNIDARIAHGLLEANFGEQSQQVVLDLWQTYADGMESAVLATDVIATQLAEGNIKATNLMYENLTTASGLNAFDVRDNLLTIDKAFDKMTEGGMSATDALFKSMSDGFGWTLDQTQQFLDKSGIALDTWTNNFSNNSGDTLRTMLDFNAEGVSAFETGIKQMSVNANNALTNIEQTIRRVTDTAQVEAQQVESNYQNSFDSIGRRSDRLLLNLADKLEQFVDNAAITRGSTQPLAGT